MCNCLFHNDNINLLIDFGNIIDLPIEHTGPLDKNCYEIEKQIVCIYSLEYRQCLTWNQSFANSLLYNPQGYQGYHTRQNYWFLSLENYSVLMPYFRAFVMGADLDLVAEEIRKYHRHLLIKEFKNVVRT